MLLDYVRTLLALKMDKRAVTAMEYGLIAAMVAVVIIVALSSIGSKSEKYVQFSRHRTLACGAFGASL
jgi:pilus assembly protein Flp/PilA